jgi:predicted O-methyltransferase YrrM
MQVGFNAGHSAEVFLENNPSATVASFDVALYSYTYLAKDFIETKFPNRHRLIVGDSTVTVPEFIAKNPDTKFDVIFLDGGYHYSVVNADIANCKALAHENTIIILDDTEFYSYAKPENVIPAEFVDPAMVVENDNVDTTVVTENVDTTMVFENVEPAMVFENVDPAMVTDNVDTTVVTENGEAPVILGTREVMPTTENGDPSVPIDNTESAVTPEIDITAPTENTDTTVVPTNDQVPVVSPNEFMISYNDLTPEIKQNIDELNIGSSQAWDYNLAQNMISEVGRNVYADGRRMYWGKYVF